MRSIRRLALAACGLSAMNGPSSVARAEEMDPALERFGGGDDCVSGSAVCPDQAGFERLASELASASALPAMGVAATIGASAFGFALGTTVTDIDQGSEPWRVGTQGSAGEGLASGRNAAPMAVLVWNRLEARKGLPFGLELGVDIGQGLLTSFWTPAVSLKWALFEGFRERYGPLPDLALRAGYSRSVGSSQLAIQVGAFDLGVSRPFVVAHTWTLTPFVGGQLLLTDVESSVVDLTPGSDAFGTCAPPSDQPPATGVTPGAGVCTGSGEDFANDVVFDTLAQTRFRIAGGAEARWTLWRMRVLMHYEVLAPELPAATSAGLRQLSLDVVLGAVL